MHSQVFLVRHGETAWTLSGQQTGLTDLPLTPAGEAQARRLAPSLKQIPFQAIYCSPLLRAKRTCELAGFSSQAQLTPDAVEWNYGAYEGLTSEQIRKKNPTWNLFTQGAPEGESPQDIAQRADHLIEKCLAHKGPVALFSHGHFLRVFALRWISLDLS